MRKTYKVDKKEKPRQKIRVRQDGWSNPYIGIGTTRDRIASTSLVASARFSDETLEALYETDDMASLIADIIPDECFKKGYTVEVKDGDNDVDAIDTYLTEKKKSLNIQTKFGDAMTWGRVYGGAGILIGSVDRSIGILGEELAEPLDENKIDSITHLNVFDKRYVQPYTWYDDPTDPKYGTPKTYLIFPQGLGISSLGMQRVHESRLIVFGGARTTITDKRTYNGWDRSVLQKAYDAIQAFGIAWGLLPNMISETSQGVFTMKGLIDALAEGDYATIQARISLMDMARSALRSLVLDADGEAFDRKQVSWTGLGDGFNLLMLRLSAITRIPVVILMGQSPSGLDATGESDRKGFNDLIVTTQENKIKPQLERLYKLLLLAKDSPTKGRLPEKVEVKFASLEPLNEKEQAETRQIVAQTDIGYIQNGVVTPEEIGKSRFPVDGWSADTTIDLSLRDIPETSTEETPTISQTQEPSGDTTGSKDVQKEALNGIQTNSMVEISIKVRNGQLSEESAVAILLVAFPTMTRQEAILIAGKKDETKTNQIGIESTSQEIPKNPVATTKSVPNITELQPAPSRSTESDQQRGNQANE